MVIVLPLMVRMRVGTAATTTTLVMTTATTFSVRNVITVAIKRAYPPSAILNESWERNLQPPCPTQQAD
jgi:thiazole synthase ThiGH ThiG subunit